MQIVQPLRVGLWFLCLVATVDASGGEPTQSAWTGVGRIVAVGDIHGDCGQMVKILRAVALIDQDNRWIGGKTHLVQTGDVFDRGPDSKKAMDLLMALEQEAATAGGMVHALIGNHESLVLSGSRRETLPAEIESFGGSDAMAKAMSPEGRYGSWIRKHNAIIKINDTLFVHGGLSAKHAALSLDELNRQVRDGLKEAHASGLAKNSSGPLWYRGLAGNPEEQVAQEINTIAKAYGVSRVVIGHTVSKGGITTRASRQLVMIDVGMARAFGGVASCLVIEGDKAMAVTENGRVALPSGDTSATPADPGNKTASGDQAPVATVRLADKEMTPVEMVLTRDIPAGRELQLRAEERLRPVWIGIYQITSVSAQGVSGPLALRYDQSGTLPILKAAADLPSGTRLTLRGRKFDSVDLVRQRYTERESRVWLELVNGDQKPDKPVSAPLVVRTVSGPVHYLQAYRKADGRLLIQAFDKEDNPADDTGVAYTITGDNDKPLIVPAAPGCAITDIMLPVSMQTSGAVHVTDNANHSCRGSALPRGLDGRSIFFGDIHCHTAFSDGDYPTEDAIAWARHRIGLDFAGPGDHISQQGDFAGVTVADYARFGRQYEQTGRFCRVPALETSCGGGHQLVCARDFDTFVKVMADYVKQVGPTADRMDSAAYYQALTAIVPADSAMVMPTHPIGHPNRWPDIQDKSRVRAAEMVHGGDCHEFHEADPNWLARGGGRRESSIRHALAAGYRLGFIGDSDNHRCLPGQSMVGFHGMTAVQANALDTAAVFDAIRDGRCYATSGARIVADATLNQSPVGSEIRIALDQARTFKIAVKGTAPIVETQIIHCGRVLKSFLAGENSHDVMIEWTDSPPAGRRIQGSEYYYIRVRQTDGHAAWLSPFWVRNP